MTPSALTASFQSYSNPQTRSSIVHRSWRIICIFHKFCKCCPAFCGQRGIMIRQDLGKLGKNMYGPSVKTAKIFQADHFFSFQKINGVKSEIDANGAYLCYTLTCVGAPHLTGIDILFQEQVFRYIGENMRLQRTKVPVSRCDLTDQVV